MLAACVGIIIIPVTLQVISRYTPLIPSYIWTEEMRGSCSYGQS